MVEDIVEAIKGAYQSMRQKMIVEHILKPRSFASFEEYYHLQHRLADPTIMSIESDIERFDYNLDILVGGMSDQQAHIYTILDPGTSQCYDSIGFHVIGSGMYLAFNRLVASKCHQDLPLEDILAIVCDAKLAAENAPGVGLSTDIAIISKDRLLLIRNDEMKPLQEIQARRRSGDAEWKNQTTDFVKEMREKHDTRVRATLMRNHIQTEREPPINGDNRDAEHDGQE